MAEPLFWNEPVSQHVERIDTNKDGRASEKEVFDYFHRRLEEGLKNPNVVAHIPEPTAKLLYDSALELRAAVQSQLPFDPITMEGAAKAALRDAETIRQAKASAQR